MRPATYRFIAALALLVIGTMPIDAAAHDATLSDPKDTLSDRYPYALDIRSASISHEGDRIAHAVTLYRGYRSLTGNFFLGVAFDTDGNTRDLERALYIFSHEDRIVGQMVKADGRRAGSLMDVDSPTSRKVIATFSARLLGRPDHYSWFAFANSPFDDRCCFDTAPNRRWKAHDIGAPVITEPNLSVPSDTTWESTTVPVEFGVGDVGGSGVESWSLNARVVRTTEWVTLDAGTGEGPQVATLTGTDGASYDVCIRAVDRSGNVADGDYHLVSFPFDDAGTAFSYTGAWTTSSVPGDYQFTRHVSSEPGASASVTFSTLGYPYLVMPSGFDGSARVTLNGVDQGSFTASVITTTRQVRQFGVDFVDIGNATPPYTITFTVESGTFPLDGLLVVPSIPPPPLGAPKNCG
jgi:hypothetical protein